MENKILVFALMAGTFGANAAPDIRTEMWERPISLREGVTLRTYALDRPRMMKAYVVKIDLTTPGIGFTATERDPQWGKVMTDYTNEVWHINTKRETPVEFMSRRRTEGKNVEIAVNTSGWRPWGGIAACNSTYAQLYRWAMADGVELSYGKKPGMGTYFIVRKNGNAEIRSIIRPAMTNDMAFAIYGNRHILKYGKRTPDADPVKRPDLHPRTAFGLTADRKTLVILAIDGRQPGYSLGAMCADIADILQKEGCTDAVNMDGGGSTSLVIWDRENGRPLMLNHHANGYVRKTALNLGITFASP